VVDILMATTGAKYQAILLEITLQDEESVCLVSSSSAAI